MVHGEARRKHPHIVQVLDQCFAVEGLAGDRLGLGFPDVGVHRQLVTAGQLGRRAADRWVPCERLISSPACVHNAIRRRKPPSACHLRPVRRTRWVQAMAEAPRYAFELAKNSLARPGADYGPDQAAVLDEAGLEEARSVITAWPNYAPTPLLELSGVAQAIALPGFITRTKRRVSGSAASNPWAAFMRWPGSWCARSGGGPERQTCRSPKSLRENTEM